jgi:hypothetical protein
VDLWICDDAFITLRYVDHANDGLGLVYNRGERVEGYTHFLWTILIWLFARLGIDPVRAATWLPVPFYLGTLWLLLRAGGVRGAGPSRANAGRGTTPLLPGGSGTAGGTALLWPVAALLWAVHREALVFASSGLETAAYTFFLLLGFHLAAAADAPRGRTAAVCAYTIATLLRPEGAMHLGIALAYNLMRAPRGARRRELVLSLGLVAAMLLPLVVWRYLYYRDWLPNPFYAKSAARPYWEQGWYYVWLYFRYYAALGIAAVAGLVLVLLRPGPLVLAVLHAAGVVVATAYVGGDFMFARFLLPATPFLALLAAHAVRQAGRLRLAGALLVVTATLAGGVWREHTLRWPKMPRGIVDEHSFYPPADVAARRERARVVAACLESTDAAFLVLGAQAMLAYFGRFPVALEMHGLTDRTIARLPLGDRGRPGHERRPPLEYLLERRVRFLILQPGSEPRRPYARIRFGELVGEIVTYDRALMEHVRRCADVEFVEFPAYLDDYLQRAQAMPPGALARDLEAFRVYYFDHNPDPERLARLEALLREKQRR